MHRIKNNATNAHLITVNVIVLTALKHALGVRENKSISTKKPIKMVQLVLKNNFFWNLIEQFKGQNLILAVGTKCVPSYACSFMNDLGNNFIASQHNKPLYGLDKLMISFYLDTREREIKKILRRLK